MRRYLAHITRKRAMTAEAVIAVLFSLSMPAEGHLDNLDRYLLLSVFWVPGLISFGPSSMLTFRR
jgi:hypothetical protein